MSREGSSALSARRPPAGAFDPTSCSLKGAPIRARRRCPLACMRTYSPPLHALGSGSRRHPTGRNPRPPVEQVTASPHPLASPPPPIARSLHAPPQSRSPRPPALSRPTASAPRGRSAALALVRGERPAMRRKHRRRRRSRYASRPQSPVPRTPVSPCPIARPPHTSQQQLY